MISSVRISLVKYWLYDRGRTAGKYLLGMKKKRNMLRENFIPEDSRKSFLEAMESIAKLASAGKAGNNGNMDYGVGKGTHILDMAAIL